MLATLSGFVLPHVLPHSWESPRGTFYSDRDRTIRGRLSISRPDGTTWEDMSSYLTSARINLGDISSLGTGSSGVDVGVRQMDLTLINSQVVGDLPAGVTPAGQPIFTRSSVAYNADGTQVAANVPRFEAGKFGQGVLVEEGTTNLLTNPSFENGSTGWTLNSGASVQSVEKRSGNNALRITDSDASVSVDATIYAGATAGTTYTLSAYAKMLTGSQLLYLVFRDVSGTELAVYTMIFSEQTWTRKSITQVAPAGTADIRIRLYSTISATSDGYWDDIQLEAKPYATSFVDGTRADEALAIPTPGVLSVERGTWEETIAVPATVNCSDFGKVLLIPGVSGTGISFWRRSSGNWELRTHADDNTYTSATVQAVDVPAGQRQIAVRWSMSEAAVFVDGVKKASIANPKLPTAFANSACVGAEVRGARAGNLVHDDLRLSSIDRSDAEILAGHQRGCALPWDESTTLKLNFDGDIYARNNSLHPRDRNSRWNQFGGAYAPLLWPNREVILDLAAVPLGTEPADTDWVRVFHGYLGDSISASSDKGRISVQCRDLSKRLQDCYVEIKRTYGSTGGTPAEAVIQQILDDNLGAGVVQLYCPVSPGFMILPYEVDFQTVWDAVNQVAAQIGWFIGYRYDPGTGDFRLTFMNPPRTKDSTTADWFLDWQDEILVQELDITDRDVRNSVIVAYTDSNNAPRVVSVSDQNSIDEYGRRAMQIIESATSLIDTEAEAQALANAALWDLKDLTGTTNLTLPLLPTMDVFDGLVVTNPRLSSTQDFYAVESVEHTLDWEGKKFRTEVTAAGRVVGSHGKWLAMQTRPGAAAPVRAGEIAPAGVVQNNIDASIIVPKNLAYLTAGTAVNGTTVELEWPAERQPQVTVSPTDLLTFSPSRNTYQQKAKVYATPPEWNPDTGKWEFDVYGMLVTPGASTNNGGLSWTHIGNQWVTTTGNSPVNTTGLFVTLGMVSSGSSTTGTFKLEYKPSSESVWIFSRNVSIQVGSLPGEYQVREFEVKSGLPPDVYNVKVTFSPGGQLYENDSWRSVADETIYNGTVAYVVTA